MTDYSKFKTHDDLARSFVGQNETDNRTALKAFFKEAMGSSIDPKTIPWCARFVNAVLSAKGMENSGSDWARNFLKVGQRVSPENAQKGDVIVFRRGKNMGHVGFIESINVANGTVKVLGGNQGGSAQKGGGVTIQTFPLSSMLGIRRVSKKEVYAELNLGDSDGGSQLA